MRIKPIVATVLGLAIAYSAYWYALAYYSKGYLATRLEQLQKDGVNVSYDTFATGGFPYRLQLRLGNARVEMQDGPYHLATTANELAIDVKPWQWNDPNFTTRGAEIELQTNWATWLNFRATATSLEAHLSEEDAESRRRQFSLREIDFPSSGMHIKSVSIDSRRIAPSSASTANELYEPILARFAVAIDGISLPRMEPGLTKGHLEQLAATIEIHGDTWPQLKVADLETWRDGGGTLELTDFSLQAGKSIVIGEGSFSLDDRLRVIGASSLIISNVEQFRQTLQAIGTDWAQAILISMEAATPDSGQLVLSIMLANGTAMSGTQAFYRFGGIIRAN